MVLRLVIFAVVVIVLSSFLSSRDEAVLVFLVGKLLPNFTSP
jgi:hypothetical protein